MTWAAGRSRWVRAGGALAAVLLAGVACSQEPQAPPARQRTVELSVSGTPGAVFGQYTLIGELGQPGSRTIQQVPFSTTFTVPFDPSPKIDVSVVGVRPGSRLSCRVVVDGRTVAAQTVTVPGPNAACIAPPSTS
ncbi:hypothetical protein [Actinomycetospora atypica]|uniref:Uncharacterized protein n=1 Tax=Actinomycetospora atypica TaxID=1290095 RepID=A0ABV9YR61_9PSEU